MRVEYTVQLIPEDEGGFCVLVPGLPGCISQGETREEALSNIRDAIEGYLAAIAEAADEADVARAFRRAEADPGRG